MASAWKEWVSVTSWHGISDFARANNVISRSAWFLIILTSSLMIIEQISMHLYGFWATKAEPWVQTATYRRVRELQIPIVHVCSNNKVSNQALARLDLEFDAAAFLLDLQNSLWGTGVIQHARDKEAMKEKLYRAFKKHVEKYPEVAKWTVYDWAMQISPNCDQFISSVRQMQNPCSEMNITKTVFGNIPCFGIFKNQSQMLAGETDALSIVINTSTADYAPVLQFTETSDTFSLFLEFEDRAGPKMGSTGLILKPMRQTWIGLEFEEGDGPAFQPIKLFDNLPLPCYFDRPLKLLDAKYTSDRCVLDCWLLLQYNTCGCMYHISPIKESNEYRFCLPEEAFKCSQSSFKDQYDQDYTDFYVCAAACILPECRYKQVDYRVDGTANTVNVSGYASSRSTIFNETDIDVENQATVYIYYKSLVVTMVGYKLKFSVADLISNIGGQLGIWGGMSLITIIQALFYLMYCIYKTAKNCIDKARDKKEASKYQKNSYWSVSASSIGTAHSNQTVVSAETLPYKYF